LIDAFNAAGLYVGSVVLTRFNNQKSAKLFEKSLQKQGIKTYHHYAIPNYPFDTEKIFSDQGLGKNDYIETTRSLVVVTAPGPGSGKMATCISQLYHDNQRGIKSGYAKFETFPIWNLPLQASDQLGLRSRDRGFGRRQHDRSLSSRSLWDLGGQL
jgi:uncharacterized protein (UPF0371 family)